MSEITVITHNIRSTHNVGSIFRTAEGFGIKKIVITGYTPYPTHENDLRLPHIAQKLQAQIHKTALGAETLVPFEYYESLDEWLDENKSSSSPLPIYALEQAPESTFIQNFSPPSNFALILGEEVNGIETRHLKQCDGILEIPMVGRKESFNVSVACGVALYALGLNDDALLANHRN